jgi:hypothetical protein
LQSSVAVWSGTDGSDPPIFPSHTGQQSQTQADCGCFAKEPMLFLPFTIVPFHP